MDLEETINTLIEMLAEQLLRADAREAARIHTRITELESLKERAHP